MREFQKKCILFDEMIKNLLHYYPKIQIKPNFTRRGRTEEIVEWIQVQLKYDKDYSIGLDVDETNESCFESIEKK